MESVLRRTWIAPFSCGVLCGILFCGIAWSLQFSAKRNIPANVTPSNAGLNKDPKQAQLSIPQLGTYEIATGDIHRMIGKPWKEVITHLGLNLPADVSTLPVTTVDGQVLNHGKSRIQVEHFFALNCSKDGKTAVVGVVYDTLHVLVFAGDPPAGVTRDAAVATVEDVPSR